MSKQTWQIKINNSFGINFKCHMWQDEMRNKDFSSIINFAKKNIVAKNLHIADFKHESRYWDKYNLFVEMKEDKTIQDILKYIKKSYKNFVKATNGKEEKVWINGWLNTMTKGMQLQKHCHANHENAYLSGNLVLTDIKTSKTSFAIPDWSSPNQYKIYNVVNKKGYFNLFPQWLYHWVEPIQEDLRIVLGFDLHLNKAVNYYWKYESNIDWPIKRAIKL